MQIKQIENDADHAAALLEIDGLMGAERGTSEGDRLEELAKLVEAYEAKQFPLNSPENVRVLRRACDLPSSSDQ